MKLNNIARRIIFVATVFLSASAVGENILYNDGSVSSFKMICSDKNAHAYRHIYAPLQQKFIDQNNWNNSEKFNSTWTFVFDADKKLMLLDDKEVDFASMQAKTVLLTEVTVGQGLGQSIWTYVLRPDQSSGAGTQVNGYDSPLMAGVKARVVEFDCRTTSK